MSHHIPSIRAVQAPVASAILLATSFVAGFVAPARAQINGEINRQIWKQKFGVLDAQLNEQPPYAGWLSLDADGDGVINRNEFIAGTNPFHKAPTDAHFRPPVITANHTTLSLTFTSVPGKLYGAESSMNLIDPWSKAFLPTVMGDGSSKTLVVPKSAGSFFHVSVTDQASQGDQVGDWAKIMLGLSPSAPITTQTSFDSTSLSANLNSQNVVSVSSVDAVGTQPADGATPASDFGLIRVNRSGFMALGTVTVPLLNSGTGVPEVDYARLPTSLTFPPGVNSLDVKVTPIFNASRTSPATVFLTVTGPGSAGSSGNYTLGAPTSGGITIYPAANPTGSGLTGFYFAGSSSTYSSPLNFGGITGTYVYTKTSTSAGTAVITYAGTPAVAFAVNGQVRLQFTSSTLNTAPFNTPLNYTINSLPTSNSFAVAITAAAVPSNSSGTSSVVIGDFSGTALVRVDPVLDFTWGTSSPGIPTPADNFTVRWMGQVLPQYSQKYYFVTKADDGSKLWVDGQLVVDQWSSASEKTGSIDLQAGVPYEIKIESRKGTGSGEAHLWWYSDDQVKQIIPTTRLFPRISGAASLLAAAPPAITSPTDAVAIIGSSAPFAMNVTSSNGGSVTSPDLPSWLTLVNGLLSGTPTAAGVYQFTLTATNTDGTSSVVMTLEVLANPNNLTRELWTSGVTGARVSDVPWTSGPSSATTVTTAQSAAALADNTGERLRGYFTAPVTGNYYFWIAASNAAELWISNNSEPVNKVLRATVRGPSGTAAKTWNTQTSQKSRWLSLIAGKKYYIEALHNTGASGASSHLSVAWFHDPTGSTTSPISTNCAPASPTVGGIIPSHVLSPWDNPPTTTIPGTLYVTNLQGSTGVTATGGAFLRVNGTSAVLHLNYIGLTSGASSRKLYNSADQVIFDINAQEKNYPALKTSDNGYIWNMQAADLAELNNGDVYLKISTLNNPAGEISGTFGKIAGSQTTPATPAYPSWTDNHATSDAENSRFLTQATFGPSPADMATVKASGCRPWIESQIAMSPTYNVPHILDNLSADPQNPYGSTLMFNSWWKNSVTAPDQLRQRAAFALNEILVVSDVGPLNNNGRVLADYYDTLLDTCFGNFRDILKDVTLSPAMGVYLDMRGNAKGDIITGLHPNENYAREILQLFSAGLYRTWPDGTLILDSYGTAVATYDQSVITGMARVFTGWTWGQPVQGSGRLPTGFSPSSNYLDPMVLVPLKHELGTKNLLDNVVLPAAVNSDSSTALVDPTPIYIESTDPVNGQGTPLTTAIYNQYDLNGLKDLEATLDNIMENSAVGPYLCRQLIQRLVTSHPKPEYVHRVVRAYNGERNVDGVATGIRGDMAEVFRAILLDYEARSPTAAVNIQFGKQREPLLRVTGPARAFPAPVFPGSTYSQNGTGTITITTPSPHRLISGSVRLSDFVDSSSSSTRNPTTQSYTIGNVTANSFTVSNTNASVTISTYSIVEVSTGVYSATIAPPAGLATGDRIYLKFTAGELAGGSYDGEYTIGAGGNITISSTPPPAVPAPTRTCLVPKLTSGYNVTGSAGAQTISIQTTGNHNLMVGDLVQLKFNISNSPLPAVNGVYTVSKVTNNYGQGTPNTFRVAPLGSPPATITNGSQGTNSVVVYPLKGDHWTRSGTCSVGLSTWGISKTDSNLNQTPMNSTTVFNFFYPDYQYPGEMAQAGMTTPEFQLTNDSNTMNLTNVLIQGLYSNFSGATNGYGSFFGSNAITMDITPYMTPALTANTGIPGLVDTLGDLMTGGNLSSAVKTAIVTHVASTANYPYTTPTSSQMRDRVRVIVNLIAISADYAIQK